MDNPVAEAHAEFWISYKQDVSGAKGNSLAALLHLQVHILVSLSYLGLDKPACEAQKKCIDCAVSDFD